MFLFDDLNGSSIPMSDAERVGIERMIMWIKSQIGLHGLVRSWGPEDNFELVECWADEPNPSRQLWRFDDNHYVETGYFDHAGNGFESFHLEKVELPKKDKKPAWIYISDYYTDL